MAKKGTGFLPCTNCGGSGAVSVIEIDSKGNTKTVRKICSKCGGAGGFHI